MSIVEFLSQPFWQRLGLTLVHFLWQGLAVAVLAGAFVRVFRLKHGNARYGAYLLAFIAMIACPVVTFTAIDIPISPDTELLTGAEFPQVVDNVSYTVLPAGDILPEAETRRPAIPPLADSIPLGQRISNWLNVSMPWVLVIWMAGVVVLSVRLLMGFVGVYRWRHHLEPLPERLARRIVSLSEGLGMHRFSRVFISPTVLQAMAVGYLRPMVLLPAAMVTQMQPEMLEAVIAHELAHIRRFDLWVNLAQRVTETLLFYHPAVWWLSICLRSERELCCDELAVKATGQRLAYATTLENVGRARFTAKQPVLAAGLGQDKKPTLGRVRHILGLKPTQRNCPFWLAGVITVLFLAALVIPTTLALTNRSDEKLKDLESVVVEGIGANRNKFECGYLAWSSKQITTRFSDSNRPARELAGEYELWWDGSKKMTTKYVRDEVHRDPEGNFRIEKGQGGTSYDGGVLSWKPDFHSDNWLGPEVTRWRGLGSQDWLILEKSKLDHVTKDWSVIDANGAKLIRCMSKNMNETSRDYGAHSVRYYNPSKGYGLVNEEWYNPDGGPRMKHTVKMLEVIPGGWFPVEVDFKSFAITDGKVYSHNHYALDLERCNFNDKSALPDRVFKGAIDKQLKYQKKLQKYLAMELRGISNVKEAAKADKVKLGAREAVEKFVAAAMAGDFETARQFADPDKAPYDQVEDMPEVLKGQNLWIMAVVADDFDAIAVSSVILGDHERTGPLVFFLDRKPEDGRDNWWVDDIDMETPDSAEGELKKFLEKHPKAQKVPYEKKSAVQVSAQELVAKIIESERRIEDIQLHMTCTIPAKKLVFYEYDWVYDSGKEFYAGFRNSTKPVRNEISGTTQITRAFDGQNEWSLRVSSEDKQPSGAIFKPSFSNFRSMMTFNTLLGFDAKERSRLSFGEAIAQAESISVSDNVEFIDGHPCYVIEAVNLETDASVNWAYDVRAWVDCQRDCRLIKFEKYRSISGKNRFKVVSRRVDNIKLKQIDGIWLPIEGCRTTFHTNDYGPPKGMTLAQFAALPTEEQKQVGVFKLTPMSPPRRLEVDVKSIRLNKGIPPERFTVAFPDGCEVYNEFTGNRYVVGEASEREAALSDADWIEQMAGLSVSELIDILLDSRIGKDKKKWFAAIHRLVEIGSTAVPELVAELRQTEKPQTQSKLALTLRAIGDPKAVPGLIDGLERSGFSSDYGIGEARTELDMFIQQHQMDPTKKDLGLGRPVREITIALEKLTGHTEGHDHFHAYDLKYDRLGSYTITPEIRDRQRQHRRQVAERWRKWWQANKDNIKPTETLPQPPTEPKPARSERLERMIMAAPEGSILTLAIVPNVDGSGRRPSLTKEEYQRYVEDLAQNGPFSGSIRGESFQWSPIKGDSTRFRDLPLSAYKDQNYLLLCARAQYVMMPELEGKLAWGLEKVETTQDEDGKPTISIQFDEKGSELLYELTRANIGNHLAIAVDSWVLSAPTVETTVRKKTVIAGDFTEEQIRTFVEELRKGMTPADQQTIKAMRLIAEAADKLNKQDIAKMGPRQVVENFLIAGLGGLNEKLRWFVRPGSAVDKILDGTDLSEELSDGYKIKVVNVYASSKDAFAVTSDVTDQYGEQIGQFMFYLSNENDNWFIYDLDAGKADRVRENLTEFLSTHSAVQVGGEEAIDEIDAEILINKVRQSIQPSETMQISWSTETMSLPPTKSTWVVASNENMEDKYVLWRNDYNYIISGVSSRFEYITEVYQNRDDKVPFYSRRLTSVFDGKELHEITEEIKKGNPTYVGRRSYLDDNQRYLFQRVAGFPPDLNRFNQGRIFNKFEFNVFDSGNPGIYVLDAVRKEDGMHWQLSIDGNRNFNNVKTVLFKSDDTGGISRENNVILKRYDNGFWYPMQVERIQYHYDTGEVQRKSTVDINVQFDIRVQDDIFKLDFPQGMRVFDVFKGKWVTIEGNDISEQTLDVRVEGESGHYFEQRFELGKDIGVQLEVGKLENWILVSAKTIRFEKDGDNVDVELTADVRNGLGMEWQTKVELLGVNNKVLDVRTVTKGTHGLSDPPVMSLRKLELLPFEWDTIADAVSFRVSFEQLSPIRDAMGRELALAPKELIQGRITDPKGQPVADAVVTITEYNPRDKVIRVTKISTNLDGYYKLGKVNWPYYIVAQRLLQTTFGQTELHQSIRLKKVFEGAQTVDLQFDEFPKGSASLECHIVDKDGKAVEKFHFMVLDDTDWETINYNDPAGGYIHTKVYRMDVDNTEGRFTVEDLPAGSYKIWIIPKDGRYKDKRYEDTTEKIFIEEGAHVKKIIEVPSKYVLYGRVLFEDGSPAVVEPTPWPGAKSSIFVPMGRRGRGIADIDDDGYFAVHLSAREHENLKSGKDQLMVNIPTSQEGRRRTVGKFPFEILSEDRDKAGVIRVKRPEKQKLTKPAVPVEAGKEALTAEKLVLKLVDNSGRAVAGAKVGTSVRTRDKQVLNSKLYWSLSSKEKDVSDEDGKIVLTRDKLFPQSWNPDRRRALYILNEERQIGAFCEISKDDERNQIELTLEPVCHVNGRLSSKDLEEIGRPLTWSNVYLGFNKDSHGVLSCMSEKQQFDFWVPPGEYTLSAYGSGDGASTKHVRPTIEVKTGQSELDLGVVDLPATKLSTLIGKLAPEIGPIRAWKNGSPVKLSELRGKAVILHFGGGYPSTSRDLPKLVELHEDFHDAGLVIIAIYNCESMEQLEQRFRNNSEKFGGVPDVPFRLAVDGGQGRPIEGTDRTIPGATYAAYEISVYTTTVLINSKGEIVEKLNIHDAKEKLGNMLGVEVKTTISAWRQRFEEVYRLEDNRILKRIAPPFIPERRDYYVNEHSSQASAISRSPDRFIFHWTGKLKNWGLGFTNKLDLDSILRRVLRLKSFEYDGPEELLSIELPGDWIIRDEVTQKVKLKALEQLIAEELSRTIQFEKRTVECQVIVATGSFKFHPPSETYEHKSVHLYTDELDPDEGSGGGTADSVNDFILILGSLVDMPVVDHTESSKKNMVPYRHHRSSYLRKIKDKAEKASKLQMLLANLTKQTELQFRIEKRPVEVWFVTEKKKDK